MDAAQCHPDADTARLLLKAGSDVSAVVKFGNTALHVAVGPGGTRIRSAVFVGRLLECDADVNAVNHGGWTPVMFAALGVGSDPTMALPMDRDGDGPPDVNARTRNRLDAPDDRRGFSGTRRLA
jgi:ankyrin repeat protein